MIAPAGACPTYNMAFWEKQLKVIILIWTSSDDQDFHTWWPLSLYVPPSGHGCGLHFQNAPSPTNPLLPRSKSSLSPLGLQHPLSFKTTLGVNNKSFTLWRGKSKLWTPLAKKKKCFSLFLPIITVSVQMAPFRSAETVNNNRISSLPDNEKPLTFIKINLSRFQHLWKELERIKKKKDKP